MTAEQFLKSVRNSNDQLGKLIRLQGVLSSQALDDDSQQQQTQREELEQQILREYEHNHMVRQRVRKFIDRLPDKDERQILKLMYLSLMRMEDAAGVLGFSLRQCYRIKQRALMHLEGMRC